MRTIYQRELLAYFRTPVGYVFVFVYLALSGVLFKSSVLDTLSGDLLSFISTMTYLMMLLCPVLTMRLICEDRQKKTDQLLMTSPMSLTRILLGKFFAAATVLLGAILMTLMYVLVMAIYGSVYPGELFVGYLGFMLQALCFLALDLLVGCFTRNQVSAAVSALGANIALWTLDLVSTSAPDWLAAPLHFISLYDRYEPFVMGQLSYASIAYYLSFILICLSIAVHVLDARRFAKGGAA